MLHEKSNSICFTCKVWIIKKNTYFTSSFSGCCNLHQNLLLNRIELSPNPLLYLFAEFLLDQRISSIRSLGASHENFVVQLDVDLLQIHEGHLG